MPQTTSARNILAGFAAGFALGFVLPQASAERARLAPYAPRLMESAKAKARGFAQDVLSTKIGP